MTIARTLSTVLIAVAVAGTARAASPGQKDPACASVLAAMRKLRQTPHHIVTRETGRTGSYRWLHYAYTNVHAPEGVR